MKLAPDGSFRISGVPTGEYDLSVAVYANDGGSDMQLPVRPLMAPNARWQFVLVYNAPDDWRAREQLGWHPLFSLDDGLARTIDWYRKFVGREND